MPIKILTDITPYTDHVQFLAPLAGVSIDVPDVSESSTSYWWLNANPKMWNIQDLPVGGTQTYTTHNERGNKRMKYKYFLVVKEGDLVVGYVASPQKEILLQAT